MPLLLHFNRIAFKLHTDIKYDITLLACVFFDDRTILNVLRIFEILK